MRRFSTAAALLLVSSLASSSQIPPRRPRGLEPEGETDVRLPNGRLQRDEILKSDYKKQLEDVRLLADLVAQLRSEVEKNDRFVVSVSGIRKAEEIEKVAKRIRGRMQRP